MQILNNGFYKINDAKCFIKSKFYPFKRAKKEYFKYEFYLGIGGNIGEVKKIFQKLFQKINKDKRFFINSTSPILLNKAFGYTKQNDFLNAIIRIQTSKSPNEVLKLMQHFEICFKRKRSFKNAPRTLDLDILYFNTKVRKNKNLIIPHPGAEKRISVIIPLGIMLKE